MTNRPLAKVRHGKKLDTGKVRHGNLSQLAGHRIRGSPGIKVRHGKRLDTEKS